jgi:hypothetical protein
MKWQIVDEKYNSGKSRIQQYNIELETSETGGLLDVHVKVNQCPRGQRPVTWNTQNIIQWLKDKGMIVEHPVKTSVLKDIGDCTASYIFKIKKQATKPNKTSKKRNKKNTTAFGTANVKILHEEEE